MYSPPPHPRPCLENHIKQMLISLFTGVKLGMCWGAQRQNLSESALKADWIVSWTVSTHYMLFSKVVEMEISPVIYCMAKRGCPAAELSLPWLYWRQRFVKELSGSRSMARCSGDLSSAISGCLVTLWGGKGFSQVPISPTDMDLLAPYSPQNFQKYCASDL